jgi:ribonuclease P protein component
VQRAQRLRRAAEFRHVRERAGRGLAHPLLVLYVVPNDLGRTRVGITVSGRVGTAVVRNRARRRLREALRQRLARIEVGRDLVVVARPAIASASWAAIGQALDEVLRRARLLSGPNDRRTATEAAAACV